MRPTARLVVVCLLVVMLVGCGQKGSAMDAPSVEAVKSSGVSMLQDVIETVAPSAQISDGGTAGPFPCSGDQSGLEFYTVRLVVDPGSILFDDLVSKLDSEMTSRGFDIDRSMSEAVRPTVLYHDGTQEMSVTYYEETGLVQISLDSACGSPAEPD